MGGVFSWVQQLFWSQEMEIAILGLQNAGKTSFVHVIENGRFEERILPTVGFIMRKVKKGAVSIKIWDMAGQKQFRGMWERYCRDVHVIVFMVDASDERALDVAHDELHRLLDHDMLASIPLLVLLNKTDKPDVIPAEQVAAALDLEALAAAGREVAYFPISCKHITNVDKALAWLTERSKGKKQK